MLQWNDSVQSGLSMLLYLNGAADAVQGGNTRLFKPDGAWVDVSPVKGSALFFRHTSARTRCVIWVVWCTARCLSTWPASTSCFNVKKELFFSYPTRYRK